MNWLFIGIPLLIFYLIWAAYLMSKKEFNKSLLIVAFAHLPFLLVNLVAPFRGALDPNYAGYAFGWIIIPAGIEVTAIIGTIVVCSFIILTKSLKNEMNKLWTFTFIFDGILFTTAILPNVLKMISDPSDMKIVLGEYLTIPAVLTIIIIAVLFVLPMSFSIVYSGKQSIQQIQKINNQTKGEFQS